MPKVVIVMPAWNEAENIRKMIDILVNQEFPKIQAEMNLLVVDNHSRDGTDKIVTEAAKKYGNVYLVEQDKPGLGWAYVKGMEYAMQNLHADAILEMDADFQHPPRFVKPMVEAYLNGAEYVIGSRYVKGGSIPKEWAIPRKLVSFFGNLFIRIVLLNFKIHDLTTGFRLTKVKGIIDQIELEKLMDLDKFAYKVDLLYRSIKISKKTVEVPLEFASRSKEKSKFNWREFIATLKVAVILGVKDKIRFIKFAMVGFSGFLVNYLGLEALRKMGLTTYWSTLFATEAAIISNFIFNNIWTFKDKEIKKLKEIILQFAKFNLTSIFAVVVQPLIVAGFAKIFGDTSQIRLIGLLSALVVVMIYNYTVYNLFIWKTWKFSWGKTAKPAA